MTVLQAILIGVVYYLGSAPWAIGYLTVCKPLVAGTLVGCILGALTATYVSLSTTLTYGSGEQAISLQADFLDQLMPKMLPLAVTLVCFWLVKKGKGAIKIMGILAVGVVALSLLHII